MYSSFQFQFSVSTLKMTQPLPENVSHINLHVTIVPCTNSEDNLDELSLLLTMLWVLVLPYDEAEDSNSKLALLVTSKGGHNGFLEGILQKSEHYVERMVREYVTAVRTHGHELPK